MTLILVAILALAAVELLIFLKPRLELSHQLLRRTVLGSAAATGIDYAATVLTEDLGRDSGIDSLEEEWAGELTYQLEGISVTVKIEDEERKFPISYLVESAASDSKPSVRPVISRGELRSSAVVEIKEKSSADTGKAEVKISETGLAAFQELLLKLRIPPGWAKDAVDSLADWIDADDQPRSFGAEDEYYGKWGYRPRNNLPQTLGELRHIGNDKGFLPEVTKIIFPFLSTFSRQINLNTASAEVLEAVFGSDESLPVYFLIQGRPFESVGDGLKLAQISPKIYNQLKQRLTVKSSFFSVWSTAVDESGHRESVYAVLKRKDKEDEKEIRVIYWNQIPSGSQPLSGRE
ncbi:MAG: general secretion pathway protein GspK [Candidatus Omnitrophica bacterium]|nr:general secretion pathway protein GspK [Candidatus Omnitrophota bacterium]